MSEEDHGKFIRYWLCRPFSINDFMILHKSGYTMLLLKCFTVQSREGRNVI